MAAIQLASDNSKDKTSWKYGRGVKTKLLLLIPKRRDTCHCIIQENKTRFPKYDNHKSSVNCNTPLPEYVLSCVFRFFDHIF